MNTLTAFGNSLVVTIQNIAEFWNVATRPASNNGLGLSIPEAKIELAKSKLYFESCQKLTIPSRNAKT